MVAQMFSDHRLPAMQRGFTILEMMVAMFVFALLGLAAHQVVSAVGNSDQLSREQTEQLSQLQRVFQLFNQDFSQVARRKVRGDGYDPLPYYLLAEEYALDSEAYAIAFVRDGWRNPGNLLPRSELQALSYLVKEGTLYRHYLQQVDSLPGSKSKEQALLTDVEKFTLKLMDGNGEWQTDWKQEDLPLAIEVTLQQKDRQAVVWRFLTPGMAKVRDGQNQVNDGGQQRDRGDNNSGDSRSDSRS